jgi:hypothetical protein
MPERLGHPVRPEPSSRFFGYRTHCCQVLARCFVPCHPGTYCRDPARKERQIKWLAGCRDLVPRHGKGIAPLEVATGLG